jgi:phytoene desaturase
MHPKRVIVIGSGFSGLATACCLAKEGYLVTVLEKNESPGGRARQLKEQGFTFDMGPSWYWMPDVFENFFRKFDYQVTDFYNLVRLDPSYRIFFEAGEIMDLPADYPSLRREFEEIEPGCGINLDRFLDQGQTKYEIGMHKFVFKPGHSFTEFISPTTLLAALKLDLLQSFHRHVRKFIHHPRLLDILSFPVLFLGAAPDNTPALYSMMNYADIKLGTWYPKGGMHKIVTALVDLAKSLGVNFEYQQEVVKMEVSNTTVSSVITTTSKFNTDLVVASADYHHIETNCLPPKLRSYKDSYWESRTMAPSSLIFYLGVDKELQGLLHHNLFFDASLSNHTQQIYQNPQWPSEPLFYVSATSKTDPSVCPEGHENLFVLIPVAAGLKDTDEIHDHYYKMVINRMETILNEEIEPHICYRKSYSQSNFINDYHAFKGNAYGLANTLDQTGFLKPKIKSKKISNLFYTGQLTVPGPGVPPSLISGQVVAHEIVKMYQSERII